MPFLTVRLITTIYSHLLSSSFIHSHFISFILLLKRSNLLDPFSISIPKPAFTRLLSNNRSRYNVMVEKVKAVVYMNFRSGVVDVYYTKEEEKDQAIVCNWIHSIL